MKFIKIIKFWLPVDYQVGIHQMSAEVQILLEETDEDYAYIFGLLQSAELDHAELHKLQSVQEQVQKQVSAKLAEHYRSASLE
jgi:hypothetical protein